MLAVKRGKHVCSQKSNDTSFVENFDGKISWHRVQPIVRLRWKVMRAAKLKVKQKWSYCRWWLGVSIIWSNYSDLTRPHPKRKLRKGNPLISGKSSSVKYYNLARIMFCPCFFNPNFLGCNDPIWTIIFFFVCGLKLLLIRCNQNWVMNNQPTYLIDDILSKNNSTCFWKNWGPQKKSSEVLF